MRYVRVCLSPSEPITSTERALYAADDVSRGRIHKMSLLEDGTAIVLRELSGNEETVREIYERADVFSWDMSTAGDRITVYSHFEPTGTLAQLMRRFNEYELFIDFPIEFTEDGDLRMIVVGDPVAFRTIASDFPDGLDLELEQLGDYEPESDRLFAQLTPKQQEVLRTAVEFGYYDSPKQASHADIAAELGVAEGTVGEHLRKIERSVLAAITPT